MTDFTELVDLAAARAGGRVLYANDEFFAPKENLLKESTPVFIPHKYTDVGKWMDGWESRRRRDEGHDWCIIRLGLPGIVKGVVVDTAHFTGNYPAGCSIDCCTIEDEYPSPASFNDGTIAWKELLPRQTLQGGSLNPFSVESTERITHIRFKIYPDGGVARLKIYGEVVLDWDQVARSGNEIDLAAAENGGRVLSCSDMFFGPRHNLIMLGQARNMGEGWETRRRRTPGCDWAITKLATEGTIRRIEVDTTHFKGNSPASCLLEGICAPDADDEEIQNREDWFPILPDTKLQPDTRHFLEKTVAPHGGVTHVRLKIFPEGGVARLRLQGRPTKAGWTRAKLQRLNSMSHKAATAAFQTVCGSSKWANAMAKARPFANREALLSQSRTIGTTLDKDDWLEAFSHHPRIGEKKAAAGNTAQGSQWSTQEQAGVASAEAKTLDALAQGNQDYENRFGYIYLICATGKSAAEMLLMLQERMKNDPDTEIKVAAQQQELINQIRLEKMLTP